MKAKGTIQTKCPSCGWRTLFVGSGGYLTCGNLDCKEPVFDDALAALIADREQSVRLNELKHRADDIIGRMHRLDRDYANKYVLDLTSVAELSTEGEK